MDPLENALVFSWDHLHTAICVSDQKELILSPCMFGVFLRHGGDP